MVDVVRPENYDEIEVCIALVWGPEGDHLQTKGELREACETKILEMRQGQSADDVRGKG